MDGIRRWVGLKEMRRENWRKFVLIEFIVIKTSVFIHRLVLDIKCHLRGIVPYLIRQGPSPF